MSVALRLFLFPNVIHLHVDLFQVKDDFSQIVEQKHARSRARAADREKSEKSIGYLATLKSFN